MHPRVLVDGFEIAKRATLQFLEKFKTPVVMGAEPDKEILKMVARTTVRTKVDFFSFNPSLNWSVDQITSTELFTWLLKLYSYYFYFLLICSCMSHLLIS